MSENEVRGPGRPRVSTFPMEVVPVRMPSDLRAAAHYKAQREGTNLSEVVRAKLRDYVAS